MSAPAPPLDDLAPARPRRFDVPAGGALALAPWIAAAVLFALLWRFGDAAGAWLVVYPKAWIIPAARWIGQAVKWLIGEASLGPVTFAELTRFLSAIIQVPYEIAIGLLSKGFGQQAGSSLPFAVPPLSWLAVTAFAACLGARWGGRRLALVVGGCFLFLAAFGRWESAMVTLASILVAVPLGVAGGVLLGLAGYRSRAVERALRPLLDLMQTIPVFAYLVPILVLFGFGPPAAIVATVIFAMPPMTRVTILALRAVPPETVDLGRMVGSTRRQMTWRVLVPSAREALMVGVNQVIMLSLNMVIIASMIGAGGLGFDVLAALRRLDIGGGLEAGLAIVALAVALDRLSQAAAAKAGLPGAARAARTPLETALVWLFVAAALGGLAVPALRHYPEALHLSTGAVVSDIVRWINVNYFDAIEGVKNLVLLHVLVPLKRLMAALPWTGVVAVLAFVGWRLSGWRLALLVAVLLTLVAAAGQWEKATVTVYLCGVSVLAAMAIGLPVGILAAEKERLWPLVRAVIDTLQTLPSFVYLMPAVMLFRVGDFTAIVAVVAFAAVPAIRYTAIGLRDVDPRLVEAARAMGCTRGQILWKVKLKLALPAILLGINQTIMFALSMLVITALVGTRDLGQEVYIALTKADAGRGVVAGLAIASLAIVADRLVSAGADRARARLGLG